MIALTRNGFRSELERLDGTLPTPIITMLAAIICAMKYGIGFPPACKSEIVLARKHLSDGVIIDGVEFDIMIYNPKIPNDLSPQFVPLQRWKKNELSSLNEVRFKLDDQTDDQICKILDAYPSPPWPTHYYSFTDETGEVDLGFRVDNTLVIYNYPQNKEHLKNARKEFEEIQEE